MSYIQIEEWNKFQHYKQRNPPWIKLYSKLLENDDFDDLPDDSKLLFFNLLMFASRRGNKVKLNFPFLQKRLPMNSIITQETLQPLIKAGFIGVYQNDSDPLSNVYQDVIPETETETEQNRGETDANYTLDEVKNASFLIGLEESKAEEFYHYYNAQGWVFGNG
ncbi:MAG TPA: hypothetical protein ENH82_07630, partial [bacterium]|nr:hypothetical protein [bacterium]